MYSGDVERSGSTDWGSLAAGGINKGLEKIA
jgi:hypothetical protein